MFKNKIDFKMAKLYAYIVISLKTMLKAWNLVYMD